MRSRVVENITLKTTCFMKKIFFIVGGITVVIIIIMVFAGTSNQTSIPASSPFQPSGQYEKYSGNPLVEFSQNINDPSVLLDGGTFHLWFSCNDGKVAQVCYATSLDGINWAPRPDEPVLRVGGKDSWDEGETETPTVLKDGQIYKMWYTGHDLPKGSATAFEDIQINIGYATSPDGIHWTRLPAARSPYGKEGLVLMANPAQEGEMGTGPRGAITDSAVVKVGNEYHMWYSGFGTNMIAISHATSPDGIHWTRDPANPVLKPSQPWEMSKEKTEEGTVAQPTVLWDGSMFEMWYGSFADIGEEYTAISHAVSQDGSTWVKDSAPALVPGPEHFYTGMSAIQAPQGIYLYYIGMPENEKTQLYLAKSFTE